MSDRSPTAEPTLAVERARAHARAHARAKQRLAELHREEWRAILEAEKAREGVRTLQPRHVSQ